MNDLQYIYSFQEGNFETLSFENVKETSDEIKEKYVANKSITIFKDSLFSLDWFNNNQGQT